MCAKCAQHDGGSWVIEFYNKPQPDRLATARTHAGRLEKPSAGW